MLDGRNDGYSAIVTEVIRAEDLRPGSDLFQLKEFIPHFRIYPPNTHRITFSLPLSAFDSNGGRFIVVAFNEFDSIGYWWKLVGELCG